MTRNIISVLALVVVMIASVFYMFTIGFSVTKNRNTNTVSMELPRTNGLLVGSRVLYRGVEVGYVTDVAATVDKVAVRWNFKRDYDIPVDSVFRVDNLSALGETYLGVFPVRDSGPWLTDGAVLAADRITVPTTVDQLSERFSRLMNQVDVPGVQTIVKETNAGLTQDQTTIDSLARGSKLLQKTFLSTRPEFATLLDRMQQLFRNGTEVSDDLVAAGPSIRLFGKNFGAVLDKLGGAVIAVNLPAGLDTVGEFLTSADDYLSRISPSLRVIATATLPAVTSATEKLKMVDLGDLMDTALRTAGTGDALVFGVK